MKTYWIKSEFSTDDGKHSITETFKCDDISELKSALCDHLDLMLDKHANPVEPNYDILCKRLKPYSDLEFIKHEFARMRNVWNLYCHIMDYVNLPDKCRTPHATYIVDTNTCLTVSVEG